MREQATLDAGDELFASAEPVTEGVRERRKEQVCPGCGVVLEAVEESSHDYMTSSPACWHGYGKLLAAQYSDPARMAFHQLVVDAYAAQHPGGDDPRAIRSVGIHLMTLALFLEQAVDPSLGSELHRGMVDHPVFHQLRREHRACTDVTFRHVPLTGPVDRARARAFEWAGAVWASWREHHHVVHGWLQRSGLPYR